MKTDGLNIMMPIGYKGTEASFITTRITANDAIAICTGVSTAIRIKSQKTTIMHGAERPMDLLRHGTEKNAVYVIRKIFVFAAMRVQLPLAIPLHGVGQARGTVIVSTVIFQDQCSLVLCAIPAQLIPRQWIHHTRHLPGVAHNRAVILLAGLVKRRMLHLLI